MTDSTLKSRLTDAMKDAMRAKDKDRLGVIRMALAEFKRVEVDERIEVDDSRGLALLDKMVKQRRDAASQFTDAGRQELADKENAEIVVLQDFLPKQLSDDEINAIIEAAVTETGAASMQDMGRLMGVIKPKVQGAADMGVVSKLIKARLSN
ncbi:GatB/YqeY domain-containing protein [Kistimonas scapharcae]|uniref:GatB/YqeY domain-containing protein n=1 Tax=Kistimonas scapharcae TaxID=1036133 RepID=A0ABP8UZZ0_9GAMM